MSCPQSEAEDEVMQALLSVPGDLRNDIIEALKLVEQLVDALPVYELRVAIERLYEVA